MDFANKLGVDLFGFVKSIIFLVENMFGQRKCFRFSQNENARARFGRTEPKALSIKLKFGFILAMPTEFI